MKHRFGIVGLVIASGLAAGLPGCGKSSPAERALASSQMAMKNLHAGVTPAPAETRRSTQQKVLADLRGAVDGLTGGAQVAGLMLLSEAQAGLAQLDAEAATAAAARLSAGVRELRAAAGLYASQAALAGALSNFDVSGDRDALGEQARSIESELASASQEKRRREGELAALEAKSAGLLEEARSLRAEESRVRAEAAGMAASARAPELERARLISRQADGLEKEAAQTRALAGQVGPLIAVADLEIERLTTQKSLLATASKEITARESARTEQSASARRGAEEAAGQVAATLARLESIRSEAFTGSFDGAAQGYRQAIGSAKRALSVQGVSDNRTTAQIAVGGLEQSLGGLEETRARALETYVLALEWIAGLEPALAQHGEVESALTGAREGALQANGAALEMFESARNTYQSSGARGDLAERVEKLLALLPGARSAEETPLEDDSMPPEPAPEGEVAPEEGASSPSGL